MHIIEDRSPCWRGNLHIRSRRRPCLECGSGVRAEGDLPADPIISFFLRVEAPPDAIQMDSADLRYNHASTTLCGRPRCSTIRSQVAASNANENCSPRWT